jgi:hypothetical protein
LAAVKLEIKRRKGTHVQPNSWSGSQLDAYAEQLRSNLPAAPEGLINFYVVWAPWVAIVFGILGVLAFLALSVLSTALLPIFALGGATTLNAGGIAVFESLLGIAVSVAEITGGVLMLQRRLLGWWILAFGLAIGLLSTLLHIAVLSLVLTLLIAYVHVEVKPRYS